MSVTVLDDYDILIALRVALICRGVATVAEAADPDGLLDLQVDAFPSESGGDDWPHPLTITIEGVDGLRCEALLDAATGTVEEQVAYAIDQLNEGENMGGLRLDLEKLL